MPLPMSEPKSFEEAPAMPLRAHTQRSGETQPQRTVLEVQYGQTQKRLITDLDWKWAAFWVGLFILVPSVVLVGFTLMIMFVSASNCTGCVKMDMPRTEFWILAVVNIAMLAGLVSVLQTKGYI